MSAGAAPADRRLPPVMEVGVAAMILVVAGGIYMAAHAPRPAPLGLAVALVAVAGALMAANVVMLGRVRAFAWDRFFLVARYALLAYIVVAGMLEFVFVLDHTPGSQLLVLSLMLAIFALDVPMLLAFSVARYQPATTSDRR